MGTEHKTPKKKDSLSKKKFFKIQKIKKPLTIGGIFAAIAIAGIVGGFLFLNEDDHMVEKDTLIIGVYMGSQSFDPFFLPWPVARECYYLFCQVAEGLFEYDYWNTTNPITNNLVKSSEWSDNGLNFTCTLRRGVEFHDGTPFNASAVKWNIDRIYNFINTKPSNVSWWIPMMWHFSDSLKPIVNKTIVLDEYTVRFVLNEPYVPFKSLLMHISSFILSPSSTPPDRLINIHNETMVGTGPFKMNSFEIIDDYGWFGVTSNTTLLANKEYWNVKPEIDEVLFKAFFFNDTRRYEEILSGKLSYTDSKDFFGPVDQNVFDICKNTQEINVLTRYNGIHRYICMNYERINVTMRKAISYAYNYTYDFENLNLNYGERLKSYLPYNFLYVNWTAFNVPDYNITKAREVLKDANWPRTENLTANSDISPGNEWEVIANSSMPLATYNTGNGYDNPILNGTAALLTLTLKQIGVKLEVLNMTNDEYYDDYAPYGLLDFVKAGYFGDYEDPNNIISPLFSNVSYAANWQRYSDPYVQDMIKLGLAETNPIARKQIYYEIQKYLVEESYPFIMLYNEIQHEYWSSNVGGVFSAYRSDFTFHFKDLFIK